MKITKSYIPFEEKKVIANKVLMMCAESENGITILNLINKDLYIFSYALNEYCGEHIDNFDEIVRCYDELRGDFGVRKFFAETDYDELCAIVNNSFSMFEKRNSAEYTIAQAFQTITNTFSNLSDVIINKVNEFDPDVLNDTNMKELMSAISTLK